MTLTLLGAFLGGVLTLLSPCSVMLLPAFFAYAFTTPRGLFGRTAVFFFGLCAALVPLGMLAGTLGAWLNRYRFEVVNASSMLVILLGLLLLCGVPLPGVLRGRAVSGASVASVFALGTVYGLAGVCAGPLLGSALTFAAFGGSPVFGGLLLCTFALGMVVPLLLLALLWNRLPFVRQLVRPRELRIGAWRNAWTNVIGGALTIAVGLLLLLSKGTTLLGSALGATQQANLEAWVQSVTQTVPNWAVIVVFVGLVCLWLVAARYRKRALLPND